MMTMPALGTLRQKRLAIACRQIATEPHLDTHYLSAPCGRMLHRLRCRTHRANKKIAQTAVANPASVNPPTKYATILRHKALVRAVGPRCKPPGSPLLLN